MRVRLLKEEDREPIRTLVMSCDQGELPDHLGGHSLVLEHEGKTVGFCWALISRDSEVALVEYFCVAPEHRGSGFGLYLMTHMLRDLSSMGKKKIVGIVLDHSDTSIAKLYHQAGMDVVPGFVLRGDPTKIVPTLVEMRNQVAA